MQNLIEMCLQQAGNWIFRGLKPTHIGITAGNPASVAVALAKATLSFCACAFVLATVVFSESDLAWSVLSGPHSSETLSSNLPLEVIREQRCS